MKKVLAISLSLLCIGMASCGTDNDSSSIDVNDSTIDTTTTADNTTSEEKPTDYEQLAKMLSEQMENDDFSGVTELFSDTVKAQLSETDMKLAWVQTVAIAGDYIGYYDTSLSESKGMTVVVSTLEYSEKGINVTYTFGTDDKIEGIWLSYATIAKSDENDSYTEATVKIGEYELDGLLTVPKNVQNPPIVIFVQGSGSLDMDETVDGAKPFRDIAHYLAENGIASLRFNKRFYQHPDYSGEITIQTEALDDVNVAIEYVSTLDNVNTDNIYILGHSLGGMLAPEAAAENTNIKGIISLAGTPRRLEDIICDQNKAALNERNLTDEEIALQMQPLIDDAEKIKTLTETDTGSYLGINAEYWYSLNAIDQAHTAQALDIPMLFLQGSEDIQVYADVDFSMWQQLLTDKDNCTFKLYDGLGHFFTNDNNSVDDEVMNDIARFVLNNTD